MIKDNIVKCESGWKSLYQPIIEAVYKYDSEKTDVEDKIGVEEIKEKYGMLDVKLVNPFNLCDNIAQMITNTRRDSLSVCEFCGTREHVGCTMNFEYKTCCRKCWRQNILEFEPKSVWKPKKI